MTKHGDPKENAIAKRVNGILKDEYLNHQILNNLYDTKQMVARAIRLYNSLRPHMSCEMLTPDQAHEKKGQLKRL